MTSEIQATAVSVPSPKKMMPWTEYTRAIVHSIGLLQGSAKKDCLQHTFDRNIRKELHKERKRCKKEYKKKKHFVSNYQSSSSSSDESSSEDEHSESCGLETLEAERNLQVVNVVRQIPLQKSTARSKRSFERRLKKMNGMMFHVANQSKEYEHRMVAIPSEHE